MSRCTYRCRHMSFPVCGSHAKLSSTQTHTYTPPSALMHFYCPHPLFLLCSSLLPPSTTTSLSSSAAVPLAWHPHSSSAPRASILSHSVSLSLLLTQSFSSLPHPLCPWQASSPPHTALLSPLLNLHRRSFEGFFAPYLTRKQKQALDGRFLKLPKTNVCEEKQLVSVFLS